MRNMFLKEVQDKKNRAKNNSHRSSASQHKKYFPKNNDCWSFFQWWCTLALAHSQLFKSFRTACRRVFTLFAPPRFHSGLFTCMFNNTEHDHLRPKVIFDTDTVVFFSSLKLLRICIKKSNILMVNDWANIPVQCVTSHV